MRFNNTVSKFTTKFERFNKKLIEETDGINYNSAVIHVLSTLKIAENFIMELKQKYSSVEKFLFNRGHILDFISVEDLHSIILTTTKTIGESYTIVPIPQERTEIKKVNSSFQLCGYLDIIENEHYEIIHVTPIPTKLKVLEYAIPVITQPMLAINYNKQTYFEIDNNLLSECNKNDVLYTVQLG